MSKIGKKIDLIATYESDSDTNMSSNISKAEIIVKKVERMRILFVLLCLKKKSNIKVIGYEIG